MALLRAVSRIGGLTFLSRVAGFARDSLMANTMGASMLADAFFVALRLPNLFRAFLAEGAFSAAFVPLYSKMNADDPRAASIFAGRVFVLLALTLLTITVLAEIFMPWVIRVIAPGFTVGSEMYVMAVDLTRLTFPYLVFICLTSLYSGVANSHGFFTYGAFAPVWLNITLIVALLVWGGRDQLGYALGMAVTIAGVIQFVWLHYGLRTNALSVPLCKPVLSPEVKRLMRLMVPGLLGAGVTQINMMIGVILASFLDEGAISYLYYADRLNQLPLGVLGVALGTALLPMLSRAIRSNDSENISRLQKQALVIGLFIALPSATGLIMLAEPMIQVIFGHGAFTLTDVHATARTLQMYALGLPAYIVIKTLTAVFFAHEDTKTPVQIALIAVAVNFTLNLLLMPHLHHVGIALATALAAWINVLLLGALLWRRGWWHYTPDTGRQLARILIATAGMTGSLWGVYFLPVDGALVPLLVGITGGSAVYFLLARLTGMGNLQQLKAQLRAQE